MARSLALRLRLRLDSAGSVLLLPPGISGERVLRDRAPLTGTKWEERAYADGE
jgi:hypothetical protein